MAHNQKVGGSNPSSATIMKSLKGYTPDYIKQFISERLDIPVENIRFFGSRINGMYHNDSDLDVAIIDECPKKHEELARFLIGDLEIELHWVEDFNSSWLKNSI